MPLSKTAKKYGLERYEVLRDLVEETLLEGQRRIDEAKVHTYWQSGQYIHEHILLRKERAQYGAHVLEKLADDLHVNTRLLERTLRFYRTFPRIPTVRSESAKQLKWSHYREVMRVPDEKLRYSLIERAAKGNWNHYKLIEKIKQEVTRSSNGNGKHNDIGSEIPKLIPKVGKLYTYRLVRHENLHTSKPELKIDLGFNIKMALPSLTKNLKDGQIIESVKNKEGEYSIKPFGSNAPKPSAQSKSAQASVLVHPEQALFTYKAFIERVVDGDTLLVNIDAGFGVEIRDYLRLRGIDCPEIATAEGKKARAFVEAACAKAPYVLLTSTRSDKYGRYLADIHIPAKSSDPLFLNQQLLNQRLAVKV